MSCIQVLMHGGINMLEKIDLEKKIGKDEYKALRDRLEPEIGALQRECRSLGIPIMVIFEGWGASGKGTQISRFIEPLDPRGFKVFTIQEPTEDEAMHPFEWRFWTRTPAKGRIHVFDRSWYDRTLREGREESFDDINAFEKQLTDDGNLIIKFFLHISKEEQKKRFKKLEKEKAAKWRVTDADWKQNNNYEYFMSAYDELLIKTDMDNAPWTIVESTDQEYAAAKILETAVQKMKAAVDTVNKANADKAAEKAQKAAAAASGSNPVETGAAGNEAADDMQFRNGVLAGVDLSQNMTKEEYKEELDRLQARLSVLHNKMYKHRVPVVLAFEGWDAGGKGGAIKRITEAIDPRGYEVVPTSAPNDIEKSHHYLWRFWEKMPKAGHLTIFDRTWYGRVMVERIEGFCSEDEWKRAYAEINHMEEHIARSGCVVLKFWMQIDKDEQERRFKERQENPDKQWKITDEDWRNRAKWDLYEQAVDEMIVKTSTQYAPWIIVAGNNKYYARIQVLRTVVEAIESQLR